MPKRKLIHVTDEMVNAAMDALSDYHMDAIGCGEMFERAFRAMISVAPLSLLRDLQDRIVQAKIINTGDHHARQQR